MSLFRNEIFKNTKTKSITLFLCFRFDYDGLSCKFQITFFLFHFQSISNETRAILSKGFFYKFITWRKFLFVLNYWNPNTTKSITSKLMNSSFISFSGIFTIWIHSLDQIFICQQLIRYLRICIIQGQWTCRWIPVLTWRIEASCRIWSSFATRTGLIMASKKWRKSDEWVNNIVLIYQVSDHWFQFWVYTENS